MEVGEWQISLAQNSKNRQDRHPARIHSSTHGEEKNILKVVVEIDPLLRIPRK
jgi:hypothetical protein